MVDLFANDITKHAMSSYLFAREQCSCCCVRVFAHLRNPRRPVRILKRGSRMKSNHFHLSHRRHRQTGAECFRSAIARRIPQLLIRAHAEYDMIYAKWQI